jgi:S1-C subfamily serine protease
VVVAGESYLIGGDVIVSVDGMRVSSFTQLDELISPKKPGEVVKLVYYRGSTKHSVDVTLGRQPTTPPSPG